MTLFITPMSLLFFYVFFIGLHPPFGHYFLIGLDFFLLTFLFFFTDFFF